MKKVSKFLCCAFLVGGITATIAFVNAQNMTIPPAGETGERVCVQVIAPAISPEGICNEFPTPCDVPQGWRKVEQCPGNNTVPPVVPPEKSPINDPAPIMPIIGDNIETDLRQELSIREIYGRIICRELDRCPLSEAKNSTEVSIKSAKITEIGTDYLKISVFGYSYKVNINNAKILRTSETALKIKELSIGDIVNITGSLNTADNYLINAAIVRNVSIPKKQDIFNGIIANITPPDTFILKTNASAGKDLTVIVSNNTKIIKTGVPSFCKNTPCPLMMRPDLLETRGSFSDLKIGMPVTVRGILDKISSKIEAQLIILKGFKATEINERNATEEIIKPKEEVVKPQRPEETTTTGKTITNNPTIPALRPSLWDRIKSLFIR